MSLWAPNIHIDQPTTTYLTTVGAIRHTVTTRKAEGRSQNTSLSERKNQQRLKNPN